MATDNIKELIYESVVSFCEKGNEPLGSIQGEKCPA
jgi:hypothetical protein